MAFIIRSKKIDLIQLVRDLHEPTDPSISKIVLRDLIISSKYYKEEEAKELLEVITDERLETEQQQKLEQQEQLSIEKLRLEIELSRNANQSATQKNGQTSRVKSLDEIVKMVRLLTVKVPNKSDGKTKRNSDETFSQFASRLTSMGLYYCKFRGANDFESVNQLIVADKMFEMLDSETATHIGVLQGEEWYKPRNLGKKCDIFYASKGKSYDGPERAKWNDSEKRSFNGSWGKRPFGEKKSDKFSSRKNFDRGNVDETKVSLDILPEKAQEHIEDSQLNITSCRNEVGTLYTKDEEVTAEMYKGSMVADSFRSEQECCVKLALAWKYAIEGKGNYYEVDGYLFYRDKILGVSIGHLVIPKCRRTEVLRIAHTSVFSSHMVPKKTLERIEYSFFWEGLRADVKKCCESRKECQLTRSVRIKDRSPITLVARPELPFQVRNMDLIGPIDPPSSKGHKYILCLVDQHTRWGEAMPVTSLSAKETCEAWLNIFSRTPRFIFC
ncbi:retrovirus-related Pol polyprotein from transposon opus [Trichonephila clavipes]|nr:retrovirus-related Pol polyprotein from transposon opus [Trichonephila clavipes]